MKTYARFATVPIGAGLAALDGGLTVTTTTGSANQSRTARSDIALDSGVAGAEFTFWGDGDLRASIGVVQPAASLANYIGGEATAIGWILNTGEVRAGGVNKASGLAAVAKGDIVGVRVDLDADTVAFYLNDTLVDSRALPQAGATWHFAVSLGSDVAGELACAANAGQWIPRSPAAAAGWVADDTAEIALKLSDLHYLSDATDAPAHARYEGVLDASGCETYQATHHWAWAGDAPTQGGNAQVTVLDPDGLLDAAVQAGVRGARVSLASTTGTVAGATTIARYTAASIEVVDDVRKVLHLRGAHDALDAPLSRAQFLPNVPTLAGQPLPVVIGAVASIRALPATADGSVSFLCDAPLEAVSAAYDRGDALTPVDDWALDPSSQQLLLANAPLNPVVVDGSTIAADTGATLEQALRDVLGRARESAWTLADAQVIDAATSNAGIGYYDAAGGSCRGALARILPSFGASWYDDDGAMRFVRLFDPDDTEVLGPEMTIGLAESCTPSGCTEAITSEGWLQLTAADGSSDRGEWRFSSFGGSEVGVTYKIVVEAKRGAQGTNQRITTQTSLTGVPTTDILAGDFQTFTFLATATGTAAIFRIYAAGGSPGAAGDSVIVKSVSIRKVLATVDLAFDLAAADAIDDVLIVPDLAPNLTRRFGYRPNAFIHGAGDLVTDLEDVPPARRIELTSACRGEVYGRAPLPARYAHADSNPAFVSCFWNAADAQAELDRTLALYAVERNFYPWRLVDPDFAGKPGDVGRITYPLHGLEAGRRVLIADVQKNLGTGEVNLTLWG